MSDIADVYLPKICPCGSGKLRFALEDARGIFCCYACDSCVDRKKATFRPEIFTDPNYETEEPIDDD